jgi:hypothetical protein
MKNNTQNLTLAAARKLLADDYAANGGRLVEIRPYRSETKFANANYLVRVRTGRPQTMSDGTKWDGWEHVGHYRYASDAIAAAMETAGLKPQQK